MVEQLANGIREQTERLTEILNRVSARQGTSEFLRESHAADRLHATAGQGAARALTILVADDDIQSAATLAMFLRMDGHTVTVAHDGEEALHLAEEQHPEVVLLDISMPTKSGYEVASELRSQPWRRNCKIFAVSGYGRVEDEERAMQSGFDAHLTKPIDTDRLQQLLLS